MDFTNSRAFSVRKKNKGELTKVEQIVMKCIWDFEEPPFCRDVIERLKTKYGLDYSQTTVYTFLKNLTQKGYISVQKKHHISTFEPTISKEKYLNSYLNEINDFWFDGSSSGFTKAVKKYCK